MNGCSYSDWCLTVDLSSTNYVMGTRTRERILFDPINDLVINIFIKTVQDGQLVARLIKRLHRVVDTHSRIHIAALEACRAPFGIESRRRLDREGERCQLFK